MLTPKQNALRFIATLPDDCTYEDIAYHMNFRAKVERGIRDIDEGRLFTQEEVERHLKEWIK